MSDIDSVAQDDQAHAELEACLRAAADVHGAAIEFYWVNTGRKALLTVTFDNGARQWRQLTLTRAAALAAGTALALTAFSGTFEWSRAALATGIGGCGLAHLWCTRRLAGLRVPDFEDVVRTATGMSDLFDIGARWDAARGVWGITYAKRYTS